MHIGNRLVALREEKKLSQGDLKARTGLHGSYISRVENGHSVPALETLKKIAHALEIPMYQLMYDGDKPPAMTVPPKADGKESLWGDSRVDSRQLRKLIGHLEKMEERDRELLMAIAELAAKRAPSRKPKAPNTK